MRWTNVIIRSNAGLYSGYGSPVRALRFRRSLGNMLETGRACRTHVKSQSFPSSARARDVVDPARCGLPAPSPSNEERAVSVRQNGGLSCESAGWTYSLGVRQAD